MILFPKNKNRVFLLYSLLYEHVETYALPRFILVRMVWEGMVLPRHPNVLAGPPVATATCLSSSEIRRRQEFLLHTRPNSNACLSCPDLINVIHMLCSGLNLLNQPQADEKLLWYLWSLRLFWMQFKMLGFTYSSINVPGAFSVSKRIWFFLSSIWRSRGTWAESNFV